MTTFADCIEFEVVECCNCGMPFAMTSDFVRRRRDDHEFWYCPRGHSQHWTGKTTEEKLREKLARERRDREASQGLAATLRHQRDAISKAHRKMRKRVAAGVCPCCNRTFSNFAQHMQHKHPEFGKGEQLKVMRDLFGMTQLAVAEEAGVSQTVVSYFERGNPVSDYVSEALHQWMEDVA